MILAFYNRGSKVLSPWVHGVPMVDYYPRCSWWSKHASLLHDFPQQRWQHCEWCTERPAAPRLSTASPKTSHPSGSLTLKQPHANFARLTAHWMVVQYLPVTKYPKRRKPHCFLIIQPKEPARRRTNSMHRFHHALMTSTISHTTKTTYKSTSIVVLAATAMWRWCLEKDNWADFLQE